MNIGSIICYEMSLKNSQDSQRLAGQNSEFMYLQELDKKLQDENGKDAIASDQTKNILQNLVDFIHECHRTKNPEASNFFPCAAQLLTPILAPRSPLLCHLLQWDCLRQCRPGADLLL